MDNIGFYKILLDTRNMEINLFWQRSNYFLVLNTGMAFGFFNLEAGIFAHIFALMGFLVSILWLRVCLGGKYWQSRWEQRLLDFEREHFSDLNFFGASIDRIRSDVEKSIEFSKLGWLQRRVYRLALKSKPSVSYSMIRLSALFIIGWIALIIVGILFGKNGLG